MNYVGDDYTKDQVIKILENKLHRLNSIYYIRDKAGKIVKFQMNDSQALYFSLRHNRNLQLKARQKGFTTLAVIDSLDDCLFNSNFEAGIIAHSLDDAKKIFEKAKLAFEMLPWWLKKYRMPETDTTDTYKFPNGSRLSVDTSYRGGTLSRLHVSEMGKIAKKYPEKAREIITGAFEAVPMDGLIDVESTAEGMVGAFYDLCQEAMPKDNDKITPLEFKFHFDPWWSSNEYQIEADIDYSSLDVYFKYLETEQGIRLTRAQKNWYFLKAGSLKGEMHQEYPSYPEEAFLASGRPVFNNQEIASRIKKAKEKKPELKTFVIKDMEEKEHTVQVKIFKTPIKGKAHSIGADPAEGLETGDNSAFSVLDKDFDQCATFAGKLDPDLFGALLVEVAKYFNNALIAWEQNNHGHAVEGAVRLRRYHNVFRRKAKEKICEEIQDRIGWLNTHKSKMEMLDELKECFRDESLDIHDEATLREMMTCVLEDDGNIIVNGKDRVVALGISIQAIKQAGIEGEHKAHVPKGAATKDVTKMSIEDKIKYYNRMARQ